MKIEIQKLDKPTEGAAIVFSFADKNLSQPARDMDQTLDGGISKAITASRFTGKKGQLLEVTAPNSVSLSRVVLVGLGKKESLSALDMGEVGGKVCAHLNQVGETKATALFNAEQGGKVGLAEIAARFAEGVKLRSYNFDKYRTKEPAEKKPTFSSLVIASEEDTKVKDRHSYLEAVSDGVFQTRDLVSEPANVLYPETFAKEAKKLEDLGVEIEVLGEDEMRKLGMNTLLAVGQGSRRESKLLVMRWNGDPDAKEDQPLALVGKGVCFDTGGISLKPTFGPTWGMWEMKFDMGGAGVVVGTMHALAKRKAKVNVVGVCGLVENMPDGNATRPGDVIHSMSGQTIEILNTDAEGRLVLADAITYVQRFYKPRLIVDLATLTGAIIIALGNNVAGLFSNNDELSDRLYNAGKQVGEPLWRMPMGDDFDKLIDSDIADMKNISSAAAGASSTTAAQFIKRFVENDTPWAHLDIAGSTWTKSDKPRSPKGATGYGVRLLDAFVAENYEK